MDVRERKNDDFVSILQPPIANDLKLGQNVVITYNL